MARPTNLALRNKRISESMRKGNDEIVTRLKQAASIGAPPVEQYFYGGIVKTTYYRWLQENPKLKDELEMLEAAALRVKARRNMAERIESKDIDISMEYLRRTDDKMRVLKMEHSGSVETNVNFTTMTPEMLAIKEKFEKELYEATARANDPE